MLNGNPFQIRETRPMRIASICILSICAVAKAALAAEVHSLDQVPGALKTPEGKATFSEQMEGTPAPDALGIHLPVALSAKIITDLLIPPDDSNARNFIGAKPWPARPDSYVAIVCTGGAEPLEADPQCAQPRDYDKKQQPLHVYLGVIEVKDGAAPRLVAKSDPVNVTVNWKNSGLPAQPMAVEDAKGAPIVPDRFDRFDLAAYKITPDTLAFGLRGNWFEGYSGGGAEYGSLHLFALEGDVLKPVLSVPMSAYSDVAGEWHKDQTRNHTIKEGSNVLVVSPHAVDLHFDLSVKNRSGHWQRLYRWSKTAGVYQPLN
jgi:hypothetical protein